MATERAEALLKAIEMLGQDYTHVDDYWCPECGHESGPVGGLPARDICFVIRTHLGITEEMVEALRETEGWDYTGPMELGRLVLESANALATLLEASAEGDE